MKKPCIVISVENEYSSVVLAGTLWMKGCDVYLANSPEECLKIIKDLNRVDVVIIGAEFATDIVRDVDREHKKNEHGYKNTCSRGRKF